MERVYALVGTSAVAPARPFPLPVRRLLATASSCDTNGLPQDAEHEVQSPKRTQTQHTHLAEPLHAELAVSMTAAVRYRRKPRTFVRCLRTRRWLPLHVHGCSRWLQLLTLQGCRRDFHLYCVSEKLTTGGKRILECSTYPFMILPRGARGLHSKLIPT